MYSSFIKRILDIFVSGIALLLLSPILILISLYVKVNLGSPIIFKQARPGKNQKIFQMYKFRTMTDERDASGYLLPDEKRQTKFGNFLRSTSLDELPELVNILVGDMSLIGPRPLLVEYLPYYSKDELRRHDVRPGLTGLAQINGRNLLSWERRFKFDIEYVEKLSFWLDVSIIWKTIQKVVSRKDIVVCPTEIKTLKSLDQERKIMGEKIIKLTPRILRKYDVDFDNCLGEFKTFTHKPSEKALKYLMEQKAEIYAYFKEDEIIGVLWAYYLDKGIVHISYLVVEKKNRGNGIGKKLLLNFFTEHPSTSFELFVRKDNNRAIDFYKDNGFYIKSDNLDKIKMAR